MTYLKIHCGKCGSEWDVYNRNMNDENAKVCPHCGAKVDRQIWKNDIIPAFAGAQDANAELYKNYLGYDDEPLFRIEIRAYERRI